MNDKQRANVQRLRDYYAGLDRIPDWSYSYCVAGALAKLDIIVDKLSDREVAAALGLSVQDATTLISGMGYRQWISYSDVEIRAVVLGIFDDILAGKPVKWPRPKI